ncbi:TPA: hypothetical protein EYO57_04540 [Candidatus Poribacteria bacterium]|nr:hypothetical protein [Candidatus Poribacteria bacterium]
MHLGIRNAPPFGAGFVKDTYDEFGDPDEFDAFYIDVYKVTVGRFKEFLKSSGYKPDKPINWVELY